MNRSHSEGGKPHRSDISCSAAGGAGRPAGLTVEQLMQASFLSLPLHRNTCRHYHSVCWFCRHCSPGFSNLLSTSSCLTSHTFPFPFRSDLSLVSRCLSLNPAPASAQQPLHSCCLSVLLGPSHAQMAIFIPTGRQHCGHAGEAAGSRRSNVRASQQNKRPCCAAVCVRLLDSRGALCHW